MKNVAVLSGGRSPEHDVSRMSAENICKELVAAGYGVLPIVITRNGRWFLQDVHESVAVIRQEAERGVSIHPGDGLWMNGEKLAVDIVFPVTHGTEGEDGRLQALLELAHLPYAGSGTVASMMGMYKNLAKDVARILGIPVTPSILLSPDDIAWLGNDEDAPFPRLFTSFDISPDSTGTARADLFLGVLQEKLGKSLLVKPEASGSSVGVTALPQPGAEIFLDAVFMAYIPGERVLVETFIPDVMELECALLEAEDEIVTAGPGLVRKPAGEESILSYDIKYSVHRHATMEYPPPIAREEAEMIATYARSLFSALGCTGYARVDFFIDPSGKPDARIFFNEINTLPGLTDTSHWPFLMKCKGLEWPQMLLEILSRGFEAYSLRHHESDR
ncbi:D-alanine--D-alanine ligase [Parasphaerochaeta coccoides]|uniref:D-alanine--D-alanine ligase n=1 Tax=Parasphaerochaeta coccoides (strain ATCC BAA-1237 / DSM 17374 / SPN1) TaxID=760011 RepID=F4GIK1_PARC1|nr:D-alanine--D-alanine ligase [Parasphaerochaeta coccoides]AEC02135.1 D-alanine--D-alanine ligase [Parasphaerochaeta coccoides DSM 17374]